MRIYGLQLQRLEVVVARRCGATQLRFAGCTERLTYVFLWMSALWFLLGWLRFLSFVQLRVSMKL